MSKCSNCGEGFYCGVEAGDSDCWCFHKPKKQPRSNSCFCENCLERTD
ncbi:cysteine-rich CWC family protein [Candidatus Nitrosotenuis cloacae]